MNTANEESVSWGWQIALGALLIACGFISLATPVATSQTLAWLLGGLILASGIIQLVHAVRFTSHAGKTSRFTLSALSIVVGLLMLLNPLGGMIGITLALGLLLLMGGVLKIAAAFEIRPRKGWGWMCASGLGSFVLGLWLVVTFPITSFVVPGIFFGVDMIFFGAAMITAALMHKDLLHVAEKKIAA